MPERQLAVQTEPVPEPAPVCACSWEEGCWYPCAPCMERHETWRTLILLPNNGRTVTMRNLEPWAGNPEYVRVQVIYTTELGEYEQRVTLPTLAWDALHRAFADEPCRCTHCRTEAGEP